jgi:hypothetical protein
MLLEDARVQQIPSSVPSQSFITVHYRQELRWHVFQTPANSIALKEKTLESHISLWKCSTYKITVSNCYDGLTLQFHEHCRT